METATNETRTVLDELYERRRELRANQSEIRAQVHEIEEQIARIEGDETGAEWHRLSVIAERSGKPEDNEAAHRAWVTDMATHFAKWGRRPDMGSHCQAEIDEEMDRLAAENVEVPTSLAEDLVAVIRQRGPSTGLDIMDATGVGHGVYPVLRKLERDGVLRSWEEPGGPERDGRPRRLYDLAGERIVQ